MKFSGLEYERWVFRAEGALWEEGIGADSSCCEWTSIIGVIVPEQEEFLDWSLANKVGMRLLKSSNMSSKDI